MSDNNEGEPDYDEDWEEKGEVDPNEVVYDLPQDALDIELDPFDHINEMETGDEEPEEGDEQGPPNYGFDDDEDNWDQSLDDANKW